MSIEALALELVSSVRTLNSTICWHRELGMTSQGQPLSKLGMTNQGKHLEELVLLVKNYDLEHIVFWDVSRFVLSVNRMSGPIDRFVGVVPNFDVRGLQSAKLKASDARSGHHESGTLYIDD